jgi:hypothetical protein
VASYEAEPLGHLEPPHEGPMAVVERTAWARALGPPELARLVVAGSRLPRAQREERSGGG